MRSNPSRVMYSVRLMGARTKIRVIHSPVWMVLIGLAVRVLYIVIAHSYRVIVIGAPNGSVNELERLAYSLATGSGFSAPYVVDTGPSAWPLLSIPG